MLIRCYKVHGLIGNYHAPWTLHTAPMIFNLFNSFFLYFIFIYIFAAAIFYRPDGEIGRRASFRD